MAAFRKDIPLPTENATAALAVSLGQLLKVGDTLLLDGPIGAGKSFFCRALIRDRTATTDDIPSPTYTLVQTYEHDAGDIWHCDLYRLTSADEAIELGLDDAFQSSICLIEWPDRLGSYAPENALTLSFRACAEGHAVTVTGPPEWDERLRHLDG